MARGGGVVSGHTPGCVGKVIPRAGGTYSVFESTRKRWGYEVRWMGGRLYCRCDTEIDARHIADALNAQAVVNDAEIANRHP